MQGRVKITKIAERAQADPLLYEILMDLGRANDGLADAVSAAQGYLMPRGGIVMWPMPVAPGGFLLCNGAAVGRNTYAGLFAVIGETYGAGDGASTFNVPDFRQKFPLGVAASGTGSTLAGIGGTIDHVHAVDPPVTTSGQPSATVTVDAAAPTAVVAARTHTHDVDIAAFDSAAGNPPFLAINFIIKT